MKQLIVELGLTVDLMNPFDTDFRYQSSADYVQPQFAHEPLPIFTDQHLVLALVFQRQQFVCQKDSETHPFY